MMDCRQAQSVLALAVGQDGCDPVAEDAVRAHLAACPQCRKVQRDMEAAHAALLESRSQPRFRHGLWPQVAACIAEWERRPQFARFNVWVPSFAAAAACLLLVTVGLLQPSPPSRDLFKSDPMFASDRGHLISVEDLARWQDLQSPGLQQAGRPVVAPRLEQQRPREWWED
jgi:hypothetical protein